mmetsp:Transcript_23444/g.36117  ORF Transcript_23444/g.36117 Transcript_23444/m.36117 type:complete len:504 (+) Transcript_23444:150-1661(+)|eukprot:CAMPEP_0196814406 /NCGR_PEP_ID=MMETSP1362-20130617/43021_1 /TAXON_ID=163516 /ORGANISM="Leptocylindrus danicus, Strain CCMP1856" /LENGTH=503 /DNA_ID=CAMNT_0042191005 /DNA_START=100 /DNA_END=1611 /DNA_ORIENTATION=-
MARIKGSPPKNSRVQIHRAALAALHLSSWFASSASAFVPLQKTDICTSSRLHPSENTSTSLSVAQSFDDKNGFNDVVMRSKNQSTNSKDDRYLRIRRAANSNKVELQTCIQRFTRREPDGTVSTVDLHAQVHFGDPEYFEYFNGENTAFARKKYDEVLYELIVSDSLMEVDALSGRRRVATALMPSLADAQTALQYGLACQLDVIDYTQTSWYCADVSKEDITYGKNGGMLLFRGGGDGNVKGQEVRQQNTVLEMMEAFVKPTTPAKDGLKTQLFSNLFLAGDSISSMLRLLLWLVPVPELSVILLDWSSLAPRPGGLSPVAFSVIESIARGDFAAARKLVFSQLVVSGQANEDSSSVVVGMRNDVAMKTLTDSIEGDKQSKRFALMYGALHCRDLHKKLKQNGFAPSGTEWRTAWTVDIPVTDTTLTGTAIAIPLYFGISGLDWYGTIVDAANDADTLNGYGAVAVVAFYLFRHVALYYSLARFVLEWDGSMFNYPGETGDR